MQVLLSFQRLVNLVHYLKLEFALVYILFLKSFCFNITIGFEPKFMHFFLK